MEVQSVKGYYVHAPLDEMRSGRVKGPFSKWEIANLECKQAGWYGSNGKVEEVWFIQFGNGRLAEYDPSKPLEFIDLKRDAEKEMKDSIKAKLNPEEIEFLNLK